MARLQERTAENPGRRRSPASLGWSSRHFRSTASLGGPANPGGSSASLGGPPGDPEGSSASLGGPRQGKGNLEGPQDAPVQSNTSDGDDGYPSSSEESDVEAGPSLKRQRLCSSDGAGPSDLPCFDPIALVKLSKGTVKAPRVIRSYVNKHFKAASARRRGKLYSESILNLMWSHAQSLKWRSSSLISWARICPGTLKESCAKYRQPPWLQPDHYS